MDLKALIQKHSVSGPRYTSYPTAPQWTDDLKADAYRAGLRASGARGEEPLALYVHIPFCQSLCYYCGCNIKITGDHKRGGSYVEVLLREMDEVAKLIGYRRKLTQISWGGGTPTFLAVKELERLHRGTRSLFEIAPDAEISLEVDPRVTTPEQLDCLRQLGFNRVSLGVQDFEPKVQQAINRVQSRERTQATLERCRQLGFRGINFDLIYGLPHQTLSSFEETIRAVVRIRPDRIALYNYARLPSLIKHQGILEKFPMPGPQERVEIFTMAFDHLGRNGYRAIGMDHFALEDDELYKAIGTGSLYRNFMGYTVKRGAEMIGVGASAIGELGSAYFQNIRDAKKYELAVANQGLATLRGCRFTPEDHRRRWVIQNVMCRFEVLFDEFQRRFAEPFELHFADEMGKLDDFYRDGILTREPGGFRVTELGRLFVRNVAMLFDAYLRAPKAATYSKTV